MSRPGAKRTRGLRMTDLARDEAGEAARWWQAYLMAENDQADELRTRALAGDEHARRQLASWLADRARTEEALEIIRPLADAGDDVAELWLARWLADRDHSDELRRRAGRGDYHAQHELAGWLAGHDMLGELRQRADSGDYSALRALVRRLAHRDMGDELRELAEAADPDRRLLILDMAKQVGSSGPEVARVRIDLGDDSARYVLARWLARQGRLDELRQRADRGDEYARCLLAEVEDQA
jgi:hypothetical protein